MHKADVTLPLAAMAAFVERGRSPPSSASRRVRSTLVYGHLADGNLHVNIVGPAPDDDRPVDAVLELVLRLGGSVSAEHGIGIAKRGVARAPARRGGGGGDASRSRRALDPDGILNPGVLLP